MHAATPVTPATVMVEPGIVCRSRRERATSSVIMAPTSATKVTAKTRIASRAYPTTGPAVTTAAMASTATTSTGARLLRGGNTATPAQPAANHHRDERPVT